MFKKKDPLVFQIKSSLGPLEQEIMEMIWTHDSITVRAVVDSLQLTRRVAYTTVMTVMDHLFRKGFTTREKVKKAYVYKPNVKRASITSQSLVHMFSQLSKRYGRGTLIHALILEKIFQVPRFYLPTRGLERLTFYQAPIGYSALFIFLITLIIISAIDMIQNIRSLGTVEYLVFFAKEPAIIINSLRLFLPAFLESLPLFSILITFILFSLLVIFIRKLVALFIDNSLFSMGNNHL